MYSTGPCFLTNMINDYGKIKDSYILTKKNMLEIVMCVMKIYVKEEHILLIYMETLGTK